MSTDTEKFKTRNTWIMALLVSIAVNGLLVGLLLSKQVKPSPMSTGKPAMQGTTKGSQISYSDPKHLVRTLSPERRKLVMVTALKSLTESGKKHPRRLFKQLRQAKYKTMQLLRADDLDTKAIEKSLADVRTINQKLAISGDALMIEVLGQLTAQERKAAQEAMKKRKNRRQHKSNRH